MRDLFLINVNDPTIHLNLTNTPEVSDLSPSFTADDSRVYYSLDGSGRQWLMSVDTLGLGDVRVEGEAIAIFTVRVRPGFVP